MTDEQFLMVKALNRCTFQPGSSPKRFVRDLKYQTTDLTPRQDWYLRRLYYSYRGQIGHHDPKPDDFDNPPPKPPRTKEQQELAEKEARGEIIVCRGPASFSSQAADELERLSAWNSGRAQTVVHATTCPLTYRLTIGTWTLLSTGSSCSA